MPAQQLQSVDIPKGLAAETTSSANLGTVSFDPSLFADDSSALRQKDQNDSTSQASETEKQTVRQRLEAEWSENLTKGEQQQTAFERRQKRRREFFQQESKRDDGRFIIIAAAVVLLPALAILAFAYFSGYLDTLSDSYTTYR